STIGALVPVKFYNPAANSDSVVAHAVVIYNMGALAVDDGRILSLFVQILFIAIIVGAVLYFFLIKSIEQPILELNEQLSTGLREGRFQLNTRHMFPTLHSLITNINSALNRREGAFAQDQLADFEADRTMEMRNILGLIGFPAIALSPHD